MITAAPIIEITDRMAKKPGVDSDFSESDVPIKDDEAANAIPIDMAIAIPTNIPVINSPIK